MTLKKKLLALLGGLTLAAGAALAQDSGPLLDLLVRKGLVSDQEAEDLRAELAKDFAMNSPAGKLDLATRVQRFALAGDVRLRYQYDNEVANNFNAAPSSGPNNDRSRYRYRFRFGPTVQLANNWITGFRLETASGATSTNDDFGAGGSTNFAKNDNVAFIGQAWIQYVDTNLWGADRVDLRFGKYIHPFFTPGVNGFWIDSDINPEGFSEDFTFGLSDGWNLAVRGGQYLLAANSRTTDVGGSFLNQPSGLFIFQTELFKTTLYENNPYGLRVTPAFVTTWAPEASGFALNSDATLYKKLSTLLLPIEWTVRVANRPLALYGTYGYNLEGDDRADFLYSTSASNVVLSSSAGDPSSYNQMFNLGVRFGGARNPGDLQLTGEYRHIESGAYTAILLDSDFNAGRTNGSGFILSASYLLTDAIALTSTFFHSENIDKDSSGSVGFHRADVLQIDLSARF